VGQLQRLVEPASRCPLTTSRHVLYHNHLYNANSTRRLGRGPQVCHRDYRRLDNDNKDNFASYLWQLTFLAISVNPLQECHSRLFGFWFSQIGDQGISNLPHQPFFEHSMTRQLRPQLLIPLKCSGVWQLHLKVFNAI